MVTNFGAELVTIAMFALTPVAGNMFAVFVAFLVGFMIWPPLIISRRIKSIRFACDSKGYFAKKVSPYVDGQENSQE